MQVTLTTIGRRTGEPRPITMYAWPDDDRFILVGSNGGADADPAWVGNLRAEPRAVVRRGKQESAYRAREIEDTAEFARAWEIAANAFPDYRRYQRKTDRRIPLFMLEPVADE